MKKIVLGLVLALLSFAPFNDVIGQQKSKTKKQVAKQNENSLLWQISGNGLKQPSYLFGTIHMICAEDYYFTPIMEKAFDEANLIVLEMDMDDEKIQMEIAMGMVNQDGKKLSEYFSSKDYEALKKFAESKVSQIPFSALEMMKPAAVFSTLLMTSFSCEQIMSYEAELVKMATIQNKEVQGLESAQQQLDLLLYMPEEEVIKSINDIVSGKDKAELDKQFTDIIAAYKNQELSKLLEITDRETAMKMDANAFLDKRNQNWIPIMIEKMNNKSVFFGVGAAHLPGEMGIINLLKKKGYTVKPIK